MNIPLQEVRITRESYSSYRVSKIYHFPTGLEVEFANAIPKTEAMRQLKNALKAREASTLSQADRS